MFTALVAKTDFDFIALDKGDKSVREAVDALMETMEEYANWGFHYIEDKLIDNPNYFYTETAFMKLFLSFAADVQSEEDAPESLDDEEPGSLDEETDVAEAPAPEPPAKTRSRWSTKDQKELVDYYKLGMDIEQLAKYFNHEEQNVIDQLQKLGLM